MFLYYTLPTGSFASDLLDFFNCTPCREFKNDLEPAMLFD